MQRVRAHCLPETSPRLHGKAEDSRKRMGGLVVAVSVCGQPGEEGGGGGELVIWTASQNMIGDARSACVP